MGELIFPEESWNALSWNYAVAVYRSWLRPNSSCGTRTAF